MVCSTTISAGNGEDKSGNAIIVKLVSFRIETSTYEIVPDNIETIKEIAIKLSAENRQLLIFTVETGLSPCDVTPDAILPLLDTKIDDIMETA